ncbi:MAG: glutamate-cysteine ligase family protein [Maricaulaceae bacterium]
MGQEIESTSFTDADREEFTRRLRAETKILKSWFDDRRFARTDRPMIGLEVEAWLLDKDYLPTPCNEAFIAAAKDPLVVEELAQFNFEINTTPRILMGAIFSQIEAEMRRTWARCCTAARAVDAAPALFGILPTVRDEMLQPQFMSERNRYHALSQQIMQLRGDKPLHIEIDGEDHFELKCDHIMLEAACTSIQTHIQLNQDDAARTINASMIASAPLVAASANSPFLYGKSLWEETRIPTFERAIELLGFRDMQGQRVGRVTFGSGYLRNSMLELFLENLDGYPPLLPMLMDEPAEHLAHLKLHNGTLWRWNRPIVGIGDAEEPHLRLEQRAMPSGPSVVDAVANAAFAIGLTLHYARLAEPPETAISFDRARANFYEAARFGLNAQVRWLDGEQSLQSLILDRLLPEACEGLNAAGVAQRDVAHYLEDIMHRRILTGRTGAAWQRSYVDLHGPDFQTLTQAYVENQLTGAPVHEWTV